MRRTVLVVTVALLCACALPVAAQQPAAAPSASIAAAALTPGARVRLHIGGPLRFQRAGVLTRRTDDTLVVATEDFVGLKEITVALRDAKRIEVSAGYEPVFHSSVLSWAMVGAALAGGLTVAVLGEESSMGIVGVRALAGGLVFAISAPRPRPVERWLPVQTR